MLDFSFHGENRLNQMCPWSSLPSQPPNSPFTCMHRLCLPSFWVDEVSVLLAKAGPSPHGWVCPLLHSRTQLCTSSLFPLHCLFPPVDQQSYSHQHTNILKYFAPETHTNKTSFDPSSLPTNDPLSETFYNKTPSASFCPFYLHVLASLSWTHSNQASSSSVHWT